MGSLELKKVLERAEWIRFGPSPSICPGFDLGYVRKYKKLPTLCKKCFKALIFDFPTDKENMQRLLRMLNSLAKGEIRGKFNEGVVVFYIHGRNYDDGRKKLLNFLQVLENRMQAFGVTGRIQWRVSCKAYQEVAPELFKSAKELSRLAFSKRKKLVVK